MFYRCNDEKTVTLRLRFQTLNVSKCKKIIGHANKSSQLTTCRCAYGLAQIKCGKAQI